MTENSEEVDSSVSMKSLDSSREDHYNSKLDEFRKKHVNEDNYDEYVQEVDSFIENVREIISDELDERTSQVERKNEIVEEEIGEDRLSNIRDKGPGRWSFDVLQVSEVDRSLKEKNWKLFELAWFLFQNTWVEKKKLESVLDELDMQSIQTRYFEKHEEMIEKDREMTKKQFQNLIQGLREIEDKRNESMKVLAESVREMAESIDSVDNSNSASNDDEKDNGGNNEESRDVEECFYCEEDFLASNLEKHQDNCEMVEDKVKEIVSQKLEKEEDFSSNSLAENHPRSTKTISRWVNDLKEDE